MAIEESSTNGILIAAKAALIFDRFASQTASQTHRDSQINLERVELTTHYVEAVTNLMQPLHQACNAIVLALSWLYCRPDHCSLLLESAACTPESGASASEAAGPSHVPPRVAKWVPPSTFRRCTTKYWVRRQDLLKAKLEFAKHLPVLLPENSSAAEGGAHTALNGSIPSALLCSWQPQKISSVYYDNADFKVYLDRLIRDDGATLVRVRWYGDVRNSLKHMFIERKCHRGSWTGEWSFKDRGQVSQVQISPFKLHTVPLLSVEPLRSEF